MLINMTFMPNLRPGLAINPPPRRVVPMSYWSTRSTQCRLRACPNALLSAADVRINKIMLKPNFMPSEKPNIACGGYLSTPSTVRLFDQEHCTVSVHSY